MTPRDTLLLCLPAALVLLACVCGLAVLGPTGTRPAAAPPQTAGGKAGGTGTEALRHGPDGPKQR